MIAMRDVVGLEPAAGLATGVASPYAVENDGGAVHSLEIPRRSDRSVEYLVCAERSCKTVVASVSTRAWQRMLSGRRLDLLDPDRKSTRLNSSHVKISYAVFCLKKKTKTLTIE